MRIEMHVEKLEHNSLAGCYEVGLRSEKLLPSNGGPTGHVRLHFKDLKAIERLRLNDRVVIELTEQVDNA